MPLPPPLMSSCHTRLFPLLSYKSVPVASNEGDKLDEGEEQVAERIGHALAFKVSIVFQRDAHFFDQLVGRCRMRWDGGVRQQEVVVVCEGVGGYMYGRCAHKTALPAGVLRSRGL